MGTFQKVIIVGAGPAGLLLALFLAREGITVQVLEASRQLNDQPRATHYGPAGVAELQRAGVLEAIRREGFLPEHVCWRQKDGTVIAEMPQGHIPMQTRVTSLPVNQVASILLDAVLKFPNATCTFENKVVATGQDDNKAWVEVSEPEGNRILNADYIIGSDGASSTVRHTVFGDNFPGYTWAPWLVAANVYYDFDSFGWSDINFILHPSNWFMAARINRDGLWRITYGEDGEISREQCIEGQQSRFRAMLPGAPEPDKYKVVTTSPYRVHQRCAERFRTGRILLVADAAHLCNPFGGLGLTGGIADVGGLFDCLAGIYHGVADDEILDKYDEVRRRIYTDHVDRLSTTNLKRMMIDEPGKALETDPFLSACRNAQNDRESAIKFASMMRGANDLRHDFTQYYNSGITVST